VLISRRIAPGDMCPLLARTKLTIWVYLDVHKTLNIGYIGIWSLLVFFGGGEEKMWASTSISNQVGTY
jgi:hypothetical protein